MSQQMFLHYDLVAPQQQMSQPIGVATRPAHHNSVKCEANSSEGTRESC